MEFTTIDYLVYICMVSIIYFRYKSYMSASIQNGNVNFNEIVMELLQITIYNTIIHYSDDTVY